MAYMPIYIAAWLKRYGTLLGELSDVTADWMGYPLNGN